MVNNHPQSIALLALLSLLCALAISPTRILRFAVGGHDHSYY
jgi:hypothetical protein